MSHSLTLLELLVDGKARTVSEMADGSGLTVRQVMSGVSVLRKKSAMRSKDLPYEITDAGRDWLAERQERAQRVTGRVPPPKKRIGRPPLPEEVRIARDMERRRKLVESRRLKNQLEREHIRAAADAEAERARIAAAAAETVVQARSKRTPLEMAWGGAHA